MIKEILLRFKKWLLVLILGGACVASSLTISPTAQDLWFKNFLEKIYIWEEQRLDAIQKIPYGQKKPSQELFNKMVRNHNDLAEVLEKPLEKNLQLKEWIKDIISYLEIKTAYAYLFGKETFDGSTPFGFDSIVTSGVGNSFTKDTNSKITGANSGKLTMAAAGAAYGGVDIGSPLTEAYTQFKIHFPNGWAWGTATYTGIFKIMDNSVDKNSLFHLNLEDWGNHEMTMAGENLGWTDTGISLASNNTYKIEIYFKLSATVGEVKIWIDNNTEGSPDYSASNLNISGNSGDYFAIANVWSDGTHNDLFFDDVIISDSFIGTGAARRIFITE